MVDNTGKTKTAMLQELESIKGLLNEEDDIPILQEVIEEHIDTEHSPLQQHDLDELQHQFQALSQTISGISKPLSDTGQAPTSSSLLEAFNRASQHTPTAVRQSSLFDAGSDSEADEWDLEDASAVAPERELRMPERDLQSPGREIKSPAKTASLDTQAKSERPALAKASGENPFLPQHIRARLHGNNPPPLFDFTAGTNLPPVRPKAAAQLPRLDNVARQRLIDEVVASLLPDIKKALFQRLDELTQQELEALKDHD